MPVLGVDALGVVEALQALDTDLESVALDGFRTELASPSVAPPLTFMS